MLETIYRFSRIFIWNWIIIGRSVPFIKVTRKFVALSDVYICSVGLRVNNVKRYSLRWLDATYPSPGHLVHSRVEENGAAELSIRDSQLELFSRRTVPADSSPFFSFQQSRISFCMLVWTDNRGKFLRRLSVGLDRID